mgnify:CR=1 FL=1
MARVSKYSIPDRPLAMREPPSGEQLKALRESLGLTQLELRALLNFIGGGTTAPSTIVKMESEPEKMKGTMVAATYLALKVLSTTNRMPRGKVKPERIESLTEFTARRMAAVKIAHAGKPMAPRLADGGEQSSSAEDIRREWREKVERHVARGVPLRPECLEGETDVEWLSGLVAWAPALVAGHAVRLGYGVRLTKGEEKPGGDQHAGRMTRAATTAPDGEASDVDREATPAPKKRGRGPKAA